MAVEDVIALIRGPIDTEVTLVVRHTLTPEDSQLVPGFRVGVEEERTFTILRAEIQTPSMDWRLLNSEELPPAHSAARIGYIQHRLFSDRSPEEMRTALEELLNAGADRFIVDLRGNPGGYVNSVVAIADMWLDGGVVMTEERADGSHKTFEASSDALVDTQPLVLVVDGASASASEILAGALRDHGRALLLGGEKTFGKGSVQIIYELSDHSSVHITNAAWFTPNGDKIDGKGLTPDIVITPGSDPLPQAIEAVLRLEAGTTVDTRVDSFK
jgi:carboxyl-terminal processing protease